MKPIVFVPSEWERVARVLDYQRLHLDPKKKYALEIKEHRNKRSLDANAYCFVLIDKIATELGVDKTSVYREAVRNIGGNNTVVCVKNEAVESLRNAWEQKGLGWLTETLPSKIGDCTNVFLYYGSSTYDTKQMSRLIDNIIQDAKAIGIETETPVNLARMMEQWETHEKKGGGSH